MLEKFSVIPSPALSGSLQVPGDKSISHRLALFAALAEGVSVIRDMLLGEDNRATLEALKKLGVAIEYRDNYTYLRGKGLYGLEKPSQALDLANSGTGLRLLTGILAAQTFDSVLVGDASLSARPMRRIIDPLRKMGALIESSADGTAPLFIKGNPYLKAIHYKLPIASAQLKSCLLLAALYASGPTQLIEVLPSRDHSELFLSRSGYPCRIQAQKIDIHGRAKLEAFYYEVPGDISSAAFFIVAATLIPGSGIHLSGVGLNPTRLAVVEVLKRMGADIKYQISDEIYGEAVGDIYVNYAPLKAIELGPEWSALCIDEFPVLFVAAACAKGVSKFKGVHELRFKESNRLEVMAKALNKLGVNAQYTTDELWIEGGCIQGGVELDCFDDHRIAMALSVAGACAEKEIVLTNCAKVATSYPGFVSDAQKIGMRITTS